MAHDHLESEWPRQRGQDRGAPLPLAARQALWRQIWQRLLAPPDEEPAGAGTMRDTAANRTTTEVADDAA